LFLLQEFNSSEHKRPILYLNLREKSFSSVESFHFSLKDEMSKFLEACKIAASTSKVVLSSESVFSFSFSPFPAYDFKDPLSNLNTLFETMSDRLPSWKFWSGSQCPILFIDEANKMDMLLKDPCGNDALQNLFEWFVANTKEKQRFHVVLGTSDSFYHLWVSKYVGSSRYTSYVIGDLSRIEASRFWSEISKSFPHTTDVPSPSFENAHQVCGGNMFLLRKYLHEHYQSRGQLVPSGFSLVGSERVHLLNAYYDAGKHTPYANYSSFNQSQLTSLFQRLVDAKNGFIVYDDLCDDLGKDVVDALIACNCIHLRPSKTCTYDIPEAPENVAIVTAETQSSLFAMKLVLERLRKNVRNVHL